MIAAAAAGIIVPLCPSRFASAAALRPSFLTVARQLDSDVAPPVSFAPVLPVFKALAVHALPHPSSTCLILN